MAALFKQRVLFLSLSAAIGTVLVEALHQDLFGDLDGDSTNRSLYIAAGGACRAEPQNKSKAGKADKTAEHAKRSNEIKGKGEQTTGNAKESNLRFRTFSTKNDVFYHIYRCPSVNKERVLDFPGKKQYGTLFLFDKPNLNRGDGTPKLIKAQGSVKIPAGNLIEFLPNEHFIMAPQQLDKLPDDAFDAVRMKYFAMDDSEEGRADDALIYLGRFKTIKYLDLDRCEISDRGLEGIKNLPNLVTFTAMNSSITGKCFKKLGVLKELKQLKLQNTDPDLSCIADIPKAFPNLWHLCLTRTRITNKAIEPLAALKSLKRLDLAENSFLDDGCIPTLACLNSLNNLEIPETRITAKGLLKLKHLPLRQVDLSASNGKPESFEKLRHEMKSTVFTMVTKYDKPPVSENEQTLFAPLSRGRKL
ncbi:MAG: hypothetical protein K2Y32_08665 [Candidatus Obscuribacterales bacterium]|nr:hypothetical protein [Candidatus Obscuribacterales bacterium]